MLFDLLLLVVDLVGAPVVLRDNLFVSELLVLAFIASLLVPLVDQLLSRLTKHALLLPVVLKLHLVLHSFLSNSPKHLVSLPKSIPFFNFSLLLFLMHGFLQLSPILLCLLCLHDFADLLVLIVCLDLAFDNGTPFVKVTPRVCGVVSLATLNHGLHFLSFVLHWLFHTLSVNFQRIYQVVHFNEIFLFLV